MGCRIRGIHWGQAQGRIFIFYRRSGRILGRVQRAIFSRWFGKGLKCQTRGGGRHSGELKHFLKGFEKNIGGVKPANLTTTISVLRGCLYTVQIHGGLALHDENVSIIILATLMQAYCNMAVAKLTMQGNITIGNNIAIIQ